MACVCSPEPPLAGEPSFQSEIWHRAVATRDTHSQNWIAKLFIIIWLLRILSVLEDSVSKLLIDIALTNWTARLLSFPIDLRWVGAKSLYHCQYPYFQEYFKIFARLLSASFPIDLRWVGGKSLFIPLTMSISKIFLGYFQEYFKIFARLLSASFPIDWRWVGAMLSCDGPPLLSLIQREPQSHKTIPHLQIYNYPMCVPLSTLPVDYRYAFSVINNVTSSN